MSPAYPLSEPDLALHREALARGQALLAGAVSEAQLPEDTVTRLAEIYRWRRREQLLSNRGCDLFDAEARARGLDPADAADDLETARSIESLAHIARVWDLADRCDRRARDLEVEIGHDRQQALLAALRPTLAQAVRLCDDLPRYLEPQLQDRALRERLARAFTWLPAALVDKEQRREDAWQRYERSLPTGSYGPDLFALSLLQGTGAGSPMLKILYAPFLEGLPPTEPRPAGCRFLLGEGLGPADTDACYCDGQWPAIFFRSRPGTGTALHELAHWVEARLAPELLAVQHAHLRLRQLGPLQRRQARGGAPQRIPAGMLDGYQECWYANGLEQPHGFEILSTTLQALEGGEMRVLRDPDTLAVCLGGLVRAAERAEAA